MDQYSIMDVSHTLEIANCVENQLKSIAIVSHCNIIEFWLSFLVPLPKVGDFAYVLSKDREVHCTKSAILISHKKFLNRIG